MANWWRFTLEQGKYSHWFQIHPSRMTKTNIWLDKMIKKYPELKVYISHENFETYWKLEWDKNFNLIKFTEYIYENENMTCDFKLKSTEFFYYTEFPDKMVNIRKLKLQQINK